MTSASDARGRVNDLAMVEANKIVMERSILADPGDNLTAFDKVLLWELMKATDPAVFQQCLDAAVESVTPGAAVSDVREQVAREIEADPFWTGARSARAYAAAIARGTTDTPAGSPAPTLEPAPVGTESSGTGTGPVGGCYICRPGDPDASPEGCSDCDRKAHGAS